MQQRNEQEAYEASQRDQKKCDALVFKQLDQRQILQARIERLNKFSSKRQQILTHDIDRYQQISEKKREVFERQRRSPEGLGYER